MKYKYDCLINIIQQNTQCLVSFMIFQRTSAQTQRPRTNDNSFYNFSPNPRKTNYIFPKQKRVGEIQVNCLPNMKPINETDESPTSNRNSHKRKTGSTHIQPTNEISCTTFMKSYIQKLKKQRKRQYKKQISCRREKNQSDKTSPNHKNSLEKNQVFMTKQMNHIFILERVSKSGKNSLFSTISVVDEDPHDILLRAKKIKDDKNQNKWEEPAWARKSRLDKIIKQLRNSKNGSDFPQQNEQVDKHSKDPNNYFFPSLPQKSRDIKSRAKSKQIKRVHQITFKSLQPWNLDPNHQQFSIEQYNQKQEKRKK